MSSHSQDDLPKSVQSSMETLGNMNAAMMQTDEALQLTFGQDFDSLHRQLKGIESAKLDVALAFTLASLCYANLQCQGQDLTHHGIHDDLQRIKGFVARLNNLEKKMDSNTVSKANAVPGKTQHGEEEEEEEEKGEEAEEEKEENPKKRIKVDTKAAARMIQHNL